MKCFKKNFQIGSLLVYILISENGFFFVWVNLIKRDTVLLLHLSIQSSGRFVTGSEHDGTV